MNTSNTKNDWKKFVVMLLQLGVNNTSEEIANVIYKHSDQIVTKGQISAVKANFTRGTYNV